MGRVFEGDLIAHASRFAIVVARFNDVITSRLLEGARDGLLRHGVLEEDIDVAWVPGALEIPLAAAKMAGRGEYAAVICLGAVIRGATSHYEHVAAGAAQGIARVSLDTGVPTIFGVITTDTLEQAFDRAGAKMGNKGYEAAVTALEMANLVRRLSPLGIEA